MKTLSRRSLTVVSAVLLVAVIGLGSAVAVVITNDGSSNSPSAEDTAQNDALDPQSSPQAQATVLNSAVCQDMWQTIGGPGDWTPATLRAHMESVLGEDGFKQMREYMRASGDTVQRPPMGPMFMAMRCMMMNSGGSQNWQQCWSWMTQ